MREQNGDTLITTITCDVEKRLSIYKAAIEEYGDKELVIGKYNGYDALFDIGEGNEFDERKFKSLANTIREFEDMVGLAHVELPIRRKDLSRFWRIVERITEERST